MKTPVRRNGRRTKVHHGVTRRDVLRGVVAAGASVPLAWAGGLRAARAQRGDALNVATAPFINQASITVANEMGFFKKVGIEVNLKFFMDGAFMMAPMISGEVDVALPTASAGFFNSLARGGPFRVILCCGQGRRGRAVTSINIRKDHYDNGVQSLKDLPKLKGMLVAVGAPGSINQYGISSALRQAGLNPPTDVRWQTSVPQPDIVKQLGQKQVDAAEITYHLAYLAQRQGFSRILASRDEYLPDSQLGVLIAREELLQKKRDLLVRFAMAYIRTARLFNQVASEPGKHPDVLQMIIKHIIVKDVELLKAVAPHWEWIAEDGLPNTRSVMEQQDHWAEVFRLVEKKVPEARIFDLGIAQEAARRLATENPFGA